MAETKCAKWRRESVPVGVREKGFEAPVLFLFLYADLHFDGRISFCLMSLGFGFSPEPIWPGDECPKVLKYRNAG